MIPESPSNSKSQMEGEKESHINTPRNMPDSRKIILPLNRTILCCNFGWGKGAQNTKFHTYVSIFYFGFRTSLGGSDHHLLILNSIQSHISTPYTKFHMKGDPRV